MYLVDCVNGFKSSLNKNDFIFQECRDDELTTVVKQYSELNLTLPMPGCPEHMTRCLLHHADFKLRDHHTSKMDVHVFLFTDLLLITKVTQRKAEKVKVCITLICSVILSLKINKPYIYLFLQSNVFIYFIGGSSSI